jgi:hypothetical protein
MMQILARRNARIMGVSIGQAAADVKHPQSKSLERRGLVAQLDAV